MTEFWLVRHGQTDWNLQGRYQGQADPPLNETGVQQAQAVAEALTGRCYAALYSSDLERARVTAGIIARRLGLEVIVDPRLREVNQGAWEGLLVTEIQERYPLEWEARQRDRLHFRAPGGESIEDVAARIWTAMDDIARCHPHKAVIVVSHGLALATMLCRVQDIPLAQARELIPNNAEIVRLEWNPPFAQ
ncbi:MAG: histidine phosphatase family protein [Caldilinea sp.]|nr:histidine phosphatase family protein [Caldilinea sp.]MDW8441722.1 histidine phosphatase family protein [Caldilineaceae bacterium]